MTHSDFLAEIAANPVDLATRLVYADWLEDRGDPRAAYLRAACELAEIYRDQGFQGRGLAFNPELLELGVKFCELSEPLNHKWEAAVAPGACLVIEKCPDACRFGLVKTVKRLTGFRLTTCIRLTHTFPRSWPSRELPRVVAVGVTAAGMRMAEELLPADLIRQWGPIDTQRRRRAKNVS